jgi:hypothetical protein
MSLAPHHTQPQRHLDIRNVVVVSLLQLSSFHHDWKTVDSVIDISVKGFQIRCILYLLTEVCFTIIYSLNSRTCISDRDRGHPCHKTLHPSYVSLTYPSSYSNINLVSINTPLFLYDSHKYTSNNKKDEYTFKRVVWLRDFCLFILYALFLLNDYLIDRNPPEK